MILYFLRHASAGQSKTNPAQDDKRPLDEEGAQQCAYVGRLLAAMEVDVDAIVSSPLKRATQTASLIANEIGHDDKLQIADELRPDAEFTAFRDLLDRQKRAQAVMVVGHNPSLSRFLSLLLSGGEIDSIVALKKGAIARLEVGGRKPAELTWCITPRLVRAAYESAGTSSRPKTSRK